jgi:hypothetical protein
MDWLEDVLGVEIDSLYLSLRSGFLLCELMNKFYPGAIAKISKPKTKWRASALPERVLSLIFGCNTAVKAVFWCLFLFLADFYKILGKHQSFPVSNQEARCAVYF